MKVRFYWETKKKNPNKKNTTPNHLSFMEFFVKIRLICMFEIITEMLPDIQKFESGFSFWFSPMGYKIDCASQSFLSFPCHHKSFQLHSVLFLNLVRTFNFPVFTLCAALHNYPERIPFGNQ